MVGSISFTGLASGLDTTTIINQLMELERQPITRLEQRIETEQRRLSLFQDLNTSLLTLLSRASTFADPDALDVRTAVSSHPGIVDVSAGPGSVLGSFSVEVIQLARAQSISSGTSWTSPSNLIGATGDILVNGTAVHLEATDTINDVVHKINDADAGVSASLVQVSTGDYRLSLVSETAGAEGMSLADASGTNLLSSVLGLTTGASSIANPLNGGTGAASGSFGAQDVAIGDLLGLSSPPSGTVTIDDGSGQAVSITVDLATDTLADIADKINQANKSETATVVAFEENGQTGYRLEINGAGPLTFTDEGGVLETLGVLSANVTQENQAGADAILKVNGLQIIRNSNTISDAIDGVTLELLSAEPGQPVTITLDRDDEAIRTQIDEFVASFNAVREFIDKHTSYDPESRSAGALLGDYAVRQIESRLSGIINHAVPLLPTARLSDLNDGSGVARGSIEIQDRAGNSAVIDLSGAYTVQDVIDAINRSRDIEITATVSDSGMGLELIDTSAGSGSISVSEVDSTTAADLGIHGNSPENTLVGSDVGEGGTFSLVQIGITRDRQGVLQVDEAKLNDALEDNFEMVRALFTTSDVGIGAVAEDSLDILTDPREGTIKFRTDAIKASIDDMNDSIDRIEDRLVRVEERLIRQFTAMETMVAQFQQVSIFLEQQLLNLGNIWSQNQG
jgi:flagellar hook-associated protein 2